MNERKRTLRDFLAMEKIVLASTHTITVSYFFKVITERRYIIKCNDYYLYAKNQKKNNLFLKIIPGSNKLSSSSF